MKGAPSGAFRPSAARLLELHHKAALHRVALRLVGQGPAVGHAQGHVAPDLPVEAGLDDGAVARDRHAGHGERCAAARECETGDRRHIPERGTPADRAARHQQRGVAHQETARSMQAERCVGHVAALPAAGERCRSAPLGEGTGVEVDVGQSGERLEGEDPSRNAVAHFTEHLRRMRAVARLCRAGKSREHNAAVGIDVVPGIGDARPEAPGAHLTTAIDRHVIVVATAR